MLRRRRDLLFYVPVFGFVLGVAAGSVYALTPMLPTLVAFALFCALLVIARIHPARAHGRAFLYVLFCCALMLGVVRVSPSTSAERPLAQYVGQEVTLVGTVDREADERAAYTQLSLSVASVNGTQRSGRVLVRTARFPAFHYGDRISVTGLLERPESFTTEFDRTFNYPEYLAARGMYYTISFADVSSVSASAGNPIYAFLLKGKHAFMQHVEALLPEPHAGLAEGLTLGVKRALGDALEDAFRTVGIIHIVVLSGYNVTIVAEAVMRVLSFVFAPRIRVLCGVLAIAAFAFVAGLSPTVLRASLMAVLVLIARATGNTYGVMRGLFIAGVLMLIWNPLLLLYDPGFQLSFLATAALVLVAPLIEARLQLVPTRLQLREFVTATLATQLFVLPLLLYQIGEFSLVSVLVNVLVLPVVPLAMLLTFFTGTVGMVSSMLAWPFAFAAYGVLAYIIAIAEWFAALPFAAVVVPSFPFVIVVLAYALMGWILYRAYTTQTPAASASAEAAGGTHAQ